MTLKCKTETVHTVELNDLEQFILEKTGHAYEIVPNEEWSNDQQHRFEISGYLHSYQNTDWNLFKVSGMQGRYQLRTILNGLCSDGHLEKGIYLINVSW